MPIEPDYDTAHGLKPASVKAVVPLLPRSPTLPVSEKSGFQANPAGTTSPEEAIQASPSIQQKNSSPSVPDPVTLSERKPSSAKTPEASQNPINEIYVSQNTAPSLPQAGVAAAEMVSGLVNRTVGKPETKPKAENALAAEMQAPIKRHRGKSRDRYLRRREMKKKEALLKTLSPQILAGMVAAIRAPNRSEGTVVLARSANGYPIQISFERNRQQHLTVRFSRPIITPRNEIRMKKTNLGTLALIRGLVVYWARKATSAGQ